MSIYRIYVEVAPMPGTQLPSDCLGAFVNIYLTSNNILDAIRKSESWLIKDKYRPVETHEVMKIDLSEYEYDGACGQHPSSEELRVIQESDEVWYGPFNYWT